MFPIFLLALLLAPSAEAKSMRMVHLTDKDMETVLVEPGYSTLIKFDSHPEPGLIGDQDAFKVEYMKNMVAIKPLVAKGQTNLFLFTKEGQYNFQLVAGRGRHDNIVYAQAGQGISPGTTAPRPAVLVDDLLTRKLGKSAAKGGLKLTLQSIATPISRTTIVLRILIEQKASSAVKIDPPMLKISQGAKAVAIENIFLESGNGKAGVLTTSGLLLIRAQELRPREPVRLDLLTQGKPLSLQFSADFGRK
jgi:hypothetical protein